ncbi:hypothetical protein [Streptacidiphilus anmyonensis]|uniref:hypothetical protein n=1 Tax=Streptacidiphilus anmyonensis TaxID=405782 RepID=UPI0005A7A00B|nr:hypothetical protein [Streptacidiphilus anmyonensis]
MASDGVGAEGKWSRRWALRFGAVALSAAAVVSLGVWALPAGWRQVADALAGPDASAPSCSWSARIENASTDEAGLVRCYLRGLADHSDSELRAVVPSTDNGGPTGFSAADFAHSRDAAAGPAIVTLAPNPSDTADASVTIRYADGARDVLEIHLADPESLHSWRFYNLGTYPSDPNAPSPVAQPS